jgi:hypothetical protein
LAQASYLQGDKLLLTGCGLSSRGSRPFSRRKSFLEACEQSLESPDHPKRTNFIMKETVRCVARSRPFREEQEIVPEVTTRRRKCLHRKRSRSKQAKACAQSEKQKGSVRQLHSRCSRKKTRAGSRGTVSIRRESRRRRPTGKAKNAQNWYILNKLPRSACCCNVVRTGSQERRSNGPPLTPPAPLSTSTQTHSLTT